LHYDEKIRKYLGFSWMTPEARLLALIQVRQPTIKEAMHESYLSDRAFYLMIKRLREDGLIHVICDPDDGRVRRVVVGNSEISKLMDLDFLRHQDHQGAARQGSPPLPDTQHLNP
jgi:DNA-binding MarR family transcriptional regulator